MKSLERLKELKIQRWEIKNIGLNVVIESPKQKRQLSGKVFNLFRVSEFHHPYEYEKQAQELAEFLAKKLNEAIDSAIK